VNAFHSPLSTLHLKRARAKRRQAKRVKKKKRRLMLIGIGHKKPGGRGVRAEVSERSHLVVSESIVYVK
jgi:hypothetical protein